MAKSIDEHEGKKYLKNIYAVKLHHFGDEGRNSVPFFAVDIYAVLEAFKVTCPARAHAIKKLLCCGQRGKGDELADLLGVEAAVARAIELQKIRDEESKSETNA